MDSLEKISIKEQLSSDDLKKLLKLRQNGDIEFSLIDVREAMEYKMAHIKDTDELLPTSKFYEWIDTISHRKDENIILYCRSGNRSYQVQQIMLQKGFNVVGNLQYGIIAYDGEIIQG